MSRMSSLAACVMRLLLLAVIIAQCESKCNSVTVCRRGPWIKCQKLGSCFLGRCCANGADPYCPAGSTCRRGIGLTCTKVDSCPLGRCCPVDEPSNCPVGTSCRRGLGLTCTKKAKCFLGRCCPIDEPSKCPAGSKCTGNNPSCESVGNCENNGKCCKKTDKTWDCPPGTTCRTGIDLTCTNKGDCLLGRCCPIGEANRCQAGTKCIPGNNIQCQSFGNCYHGKCCKIYPYKCPVGSQCVVGSNTVCNAVGTCPNGKCCVDHEACTGSESCIPYWRLCQPGGSKKRCRYFGNMKGRCCQVAKLSIRG